jgi:hypothetical protein
MTCEEAVPGKASIRLVARYKVIRKTTGAVEKCAAGGWVRLGAE